jgi:predicted nucleic acid-binding protein
MNLQHKNAVALDACVLFPAPIRDLLLHLASVDLYQPKWSDLIQEEWSRNLLKKRPDLNATQLKRTIKEMNRAFPDANVTDFESKIEGLTLPDPGDLHVLAMAIHSQARMIVTFNLKDFPKKQLREFHIEPRHPDNFILDLIDISPEKVLLAFKNQVNFLRNPPKTDGQVLEILEKCGLTKTSKWLGMVLESAMIA